MTEQDREQPATGGRELDADGLPMVSDVATIMHTLSCSACEMRKGPAHLTPVVSLCAEGRRLAALRAPAEDRR
jgi:hypothetical protein